MVKTTTPVKWGDLKQVDEITYHLYAVYWDPAKELLYINSSNNDSHHEDLAKALSGDGVIKIQGENVYRVMSGIERLVPTSIGLLDVRDRNRRFSMHGGADVVEGFPQAEAQTKSKTNIFGLGYTQGRRTSIGASLKGRIWSYRVARDLNEWREWCDGIGTRLMDAGIDLDVVMKSFLIPADIHKRPNLVPLAVEWPWEVLIRTSEDVGIVTANGPWPILDADFLLLSQEVSGPLQFSVVADNASYPYELDLSEGMRFKPLAEDPVLTLRGPVEVTLGQFLNRRGLYFLFEKETIVQPPGVLVAVDRDLPPFAKDRLTVLDWGNTDFTIESQGKTREADSIQAHMIRTLFTADDWEVVLDDDGSGEMADIVGIKQVAQDLVVHLIHCKWVKGGKSRGQVGDLYEVCGQAQKSARWRHNPEQFLRNLIRRERYRQRKHNRSGFEKGSLQALQRLFDESRYLIPRFTITIAQPGVSQQQFSAAQAQLAAATEVYLRETAASAFALYCNA